MSRIIVFLFCAAMYFSFCSSASAQEPQTETVPVQQATEKPAFSPPRLRLLIHANKGLGPDGDVQMYLRVIPSPNLPDGLKPIVFGGVGIDVTRWLNMQLLGAYHFLPKEPALSISFQPRVGKWWGWTGNDILLRSMGGYAMIMAEREVLPWLNVGVELEASGNYLDAKSWNVGGGPNILFRWGKIGLDLAMHYREKQADLFVRVQVFAF